MLLKYTIKYFINISGETDQIILTRTISNDHLNIIDKIYNLSSLSYFIIEHYENIKNDFSINNYDLLVV